MNEEALKKFTIVLTDDLVKQALEVEQDPWAVGLNGAVVVVAAFSGRNVASSDIGWFFMNCTEVVELRKAGKIQRGYTDEEVRRVGLFLMNYGRRLLAGDTIKSIKKERGIG